MILLFVFQFSVSSYSVLIRYQIRINSVCPEYVSKDKLKKGGNIYSFSQ